MNFHELLILAKSGDDLANEKILAMYQPLLTKESVIDGVWDEDLYQELCIQLEENYDAALSCIDQAATNFPKDKKYALTVKFEIARLFHKTDEMERVIKVLEVDGSNENTIVICRSKLLADQNRIDDAVDYFCNNIAFFTDDSKKAFCEKLRSRTTSPV